VDGLSDNNAEMRQKVYEKARSAVRRQLESMNPRPSDDLMKRQLDKLDAAIGEVELDHAEALPPEDIAPEPVLEAVQPEPVAAEPEPVEPEPVETAPVEPERVEPEPVELAPEQALPQETAAEEPVIEPEPAVQAEERIEERAEDRWQPVDEPLPAPVEQPVAEQYVETPVYEEPVAAQPVQDEPVVAEAEPEPEPVLQPEPEQQSLPEPEPEPVPAVEPTFEEPRFDHEPQPVAVEAHSEPSWQVEAAPAEDYVPSWQEPSVDAGRTAEMGVEPVEAVLPEAQVYPVHDEQLPEAAPVADARMPAAEAQWNWDETVTVGTPSDNGGQPQALPVDPLAWEWPEEKSADVPAKQETPVQAGGQTGAQTNAQTSAQTSEWGDLEDLIGFAPKNAPATTATAASPAAEATVAGDPVAASPAVETARMPQRSFRAEPRKSRFNFAALGALVGLVAIVGGAGAAYWFNRDVVNGWVNEMVASVTAPSTGETTETPQTPETVEGGRNLPATTTPSEDAAAPENGTEASPTTEVASASSDASSKFTQRLLTDGTEVDEGPAPALDGAVVEEGKSVAAQTPETAAATEGGALAAGATAGGTTAAGAEGTAQTPAENGTATTAGAETPATTGEQPAAVGVTQKMFLYEERLGQTAPTAIEGTVAWSSAEEAPGGDAKPEPVVRAQVNVPSKGLTALITFRRNGDRSLPASHLVEIVFSLPETFEGGGIESVQRVAMKRTEQDRGDALIAVPAKITDDFHMIALNDFPEAIAKNTELLRTRSWVDIPITYRNGRRALLTLDKGTAGAEAFDKVMKAWATLGSPNSQ
jgi:hypothetical protein